MYNNTKTYKLVLDNKSIIIKARNLTEAMKKMESLGFIEINNNNKYELRDIHSSSYHNKNNIDKRSGGYN